MPIRKLTLIEAAERFISSYRCHLIPNSAASRIDPRYCNGCIDAFEDLIFAHDGTTSHDPLKRVVGGLKFQQPEADILRLPVRASNG